METPRTISSEAHQDHIIPCKQYMVKLMQNYGSILSYQGLVFRWSKKTRSFSTFATLPTHNIPDPFHPVSGLLISSMTIGGIKVLKMSFWIEVVLENIFSTPPLMDIIDSLDWIMIVFHHHWLDKTGIIGFEKTMKRCYATNKDALWVSSE